MQSNVIASTYTGFTTPGAARVPPLLGWAIAALGIVAPLLLVIYAFAASADAPERARIIVDGCQILVLVLVGTTSFAASYLLGVDAGLKAARYDMGQPVSA
jgi:hypothetical protein